MTRRVYWCSRCEYIGDKPDHVDHAEDRWCTGVPVEHWLIDPSEAREGWIYEQDDENGTNWAVYAEGHEDMDRVLVVPVPVPPTNQEAS